VSSRESCTSCRQELRRGPDRPVTRTRNRGSTLDDRCIGAMDLRKSSTFVVVASKLCCSVSLIGRSRLTFVAAFPGRKLTAMGGVEERP